MYPKLSAGRLENLVKLTEPSSSSSGAAAASVGEKSDVARVHADLRERAEAHLAQLAQAEEEGKDDPGANII